MQDALLQKRINVVQIVVGCSLNLAKEKLRYLTEFLANKIIHMNTETENLQVYMTNAGDY